MKEIKSNWEIFRVDEDIYIKYEVLIKLIIETESMYDDERRWWFDMLPSMTDEQIDRLFNILETERKKLERLEEKYQEAIKDLDEKPLIEWKEFKMKDSKKKNKEYEEDKKEDADDVLDMLNDL